jgi:ABC-type branched-subunit amino acid transport system substrate-binding protein
MIKAGALVPGKGNLGLLDDTCAPFPQVIDQELKPYLQQHGVAFTEARVSCDLSQAQGQVPNAVLQFRQAGVDRVFLGTIFATAQVFMQSAQGQAWRPANGYATSDVWSNNYDFTSKNYPPDQFDGAVATAYSRSGEEAAHVPYVPVVQRCSKALQDAGLPPVTDQAGKDAEVVAFCDFVFLWQAAMQKAGPNPTRATLIEAVKTVGHYQGAMSADAVFGPGKFEGGDSYAILQWRRGCSCWVQTQPHQTALA